MASPQAHTQGRFVCKICLTQNKRIQSFLDKRCEDKERHKSQSPKEFVEWNGTELVTSHRPIPKMSPQLIEKLRGVAMCDQSKSCRLEECTYAHNREEFTRFNQWLTQQKS